MKWRCFSNDCKRVSDATKRCRARSHRCVQEFATFRRDHEALIDATRVLVGERDLLQKRVTELEVINKRLVDMLWGRRSERRSDSPDQMQLAFAVEPPSAEQQEIIMAQAKADEATDLELLRRLEARRKARRKRSSLATRISRPISSGASGSSIFPKKRRRG